MPTAYPVGAFLLTRSASRTGRLIRLGQALIGDDSRYNHAALIVHGGQVVEATPTGAALTPLARYTDRLDVTVCDTPVRRDVVDAVASGDLTAADAPGYEDMLRDEIADAAVRLVGTPYGWLDYLSIALLHWLGADPHDHRRRPLLGWLRRLVVARVRTGRRLICSQLVDTVYATSGLHLFTDHRYSGDVTPGDLDRYRIAHLEGRPELAVAA
jgi:hypothetical protein